MVVGGTSSHGMVFIVIFLVFLQIYWFSGRGGHRSSGSIKSSVNGSRSPSGISVQSSHNKCSRVWSGMPRLPPDSVYKVNSSFWSDLGDIFERIPCDDAKNIFLSCHYTSLRLPCCIYFLAFLLGKSINFVCLRFTHLYAGWLTFGAVSES